MSFILDANYVITLLEIGILDSLLNLKEIVVPKIMCREEMKHIKDFLQLMKDNPKKFIITDVTHEQKSRLLNEIASALISNDLEFLIETENQCDKIAVPTGWNKVVDVFLITNNTPKALKNVLTNGSVSEFAIVKKTETRRILEHPDAHLCALGLCYKKCYILSMDAGIWVALQLLDPAKFKRRIVPIFKYLALIFRDNPIEFIDILTEVIRKSHTFAKDISGKLASRVSYVDLEKSVDMVLNRCLAEIIEERIWQYDKSRLPNLMELKDKVREVVRMHTKINDTLSFDDAQFIKDLNEIKDKLQELSSINN